MDKADLLVRAAGEEDWPGLIQLIRKGIAPGDALVYDRDLTNEQIRRLWEGEQVLVAETHAGRLAGTVKIARNQAGPGSHVANASFVVDPGMRRSGAGRRLCREALARASRAGYLAMQFNAVVESNLAAVALWRSEGFRIVGRTPDGFLHPALGYVDLLIMHRFLDDV